MPYWDQPWVRKCSHLPYDERMDAKRRPPPGTRCQKCHGLLRREIGVDLDGGVIIAEYVCYNCGRRWYGEDEPRPLTAA